MVYDIGRLREHFSKSDLEVVDAFTLPKRRQEWMLSRIAEKELRARGATGRLVSYSHSGGYGAAAVDGTPIGIDVEMMRAISPGAAHLFLTRAEEALAAELRIQNALLHFWSAKEARWKQLGGSIATLKRVPLALAEERASGLLFDSVETLATGDVVVALTRPTS